MAAEYLLDPKRKKRVQAKRSGGSAIRGSENPRIQAATQNATSNAEVATRLRQQAIERARAAATEESARRGQFNLRFNNATQPRAGAGRFASKTAVSLDQGRTGEGVARASRPLEPLLQARSPEGRAALERVARTSELGSSSTPRAAPAAPNAAPPPPRPAPAAPAASGAGGPGSASAAEAKAGSTFSRLRAKLPRYLGGTSGSSGGGGGGGGVPPAAASSGPGFGARVKSGAKTLGKGVGSGVVGSLILEKGLRPAGNLGGAIAESVVPGYQGPDQSLYSAGNRRTPEQRIADQLDPVAETYFDPIRRQTALARERSQRASESGPEATGGELALTKAFFENDLSRAVTESGIGAKIYDAIGEGDLLGRLERAGGKKQTETPTTQSTTQATTDQPEADRIQRANTSIDRMTSGIPRTGPAGFGWDSNPANLEPGSGFIRSADGRITRILPREQQPAAAKPAAAKPQRINHQSADGAIQPEGRRTASLRELGISVNPKNFALPGILMGTNQLIRNEEVRNRRDADLASGRALTEGRKRVYDVANDAAENQISALRARTAQQAANTGDARLVFDALESKNPEAQRMVLSLGTAEDAAPVLKQNADRVALAKIADLTDSYPGFRYLADRISDRLSGRTPGGSLEQGLGGMRVDAKRRIVGPNGRFVGSLSDVEDPELANYILRRIQEEGGTVESGQVTRGG